MTRPTPIKPYFRGVSGRSAPTPTKGGGVSPTAAGMMASGRLPSSPSTPRFA